MRHYLAACLASIALATPAPLAFADDDGYRGAATVSMDEAIAIAQSYGMVRLKEIELDDGEWEIEGCTADGREIEIDIHARTGDVVELEIERDDDC